MIRTNLEMIADIESRLPLSHRLRSAFMTADRSFFLPANIAPESRYGDHPLPIGHGQTNSQPYTLAFMLRLLDVEPGQSVLDIGCGSGWTTALLMLLCSPGGRVRGLERIPDLADFGRRNLAAMGMDREIISQAGPVPGLPGQSFDRILVSASAQSMPPLLLKQLAPGGVMVIPVRHSVWRVQRLDNDTGEPGDGEFSREEFPGFSFVPLL